MDSVKRLLSSRLVVIAIVAIVALLIVAISLGVLATGKNIVAALSSRERAEALLKEAGGNRTLLAAVSGEDPLGSKAMKQLDFDIMNLEGVVRHSKLLANEQLDEIEARLARAGKVVDASS